MLNDTVDKVESKICCKRTPYAKKVCEFLSKIKDLIEVSLRSYFIEHCQTERDNLENIERK